MRPPFHTGRIAARCVLLLAAALTSCSGNRTDSASTRAPGKDSVAASAPRIVPADAAQLIAAVKRPGAKATLVNVWATWCAPCVKEMPELLRLEREYRDQGLRVMLVSADFDSAAPIDFLARRGVAFDTWFKTGGDQEFIDALDPRWTGALPVTVIFDSQGRRRVFWEGSADYDRFEQAVLAAMDDEKSPTPSTGGTR